MTRALIAILAVVMLALAARSGTGAPSLRNQTHSDFNHPDMQICRGRLRALGGCPRS